MKIFTVNWLVLLALLSACSTMPESPAIRYGDSSKEYLSELHSWQFNGRLSLTARDDSWTAAITWRHIPSKEQIKLAGPLGQGATLIELTDDSVKIDRGNGNVQSSNAPESFVNQQLGMFVPLRSLGYWVLGLVQPLQPSQRMDEGFLQNGWYVDYREMQAVGDQVMPRKMTVMNDRVKLKLFIDQWVLDGATTR